MMAVLESRELTEEDIQTCVPVLDTVTIFGGLSPPQLAVVLRHCRWSRYAKDSLIFRQGDSPTDLYIVIDGWVKIIVDLEGHPLVLAAFKRGDCFGETSAIGILQHSASALVVEEARLLTLSPRALYAIHREDAALFGLLILNVAREACRRLHRTDQTFLHYAKREQRLVDTF